MEGLVKLIGILMIVAGAVFMTKPSIMKKVMLFWAKDSRIYMGAIISIAIGIIFLLAAARCSIPWIVVLVGIISLVKGIVLFAVGPKKSIAFMNNRYLAKPVKVLRPMALIALLFGIILIYSV